MIDLILSDEKHVWNPLIASGIVTEVVPSSIKGDVAVWEIDFWTSPSDDLDMLAETVATRTEPETDPGIPIVAVVTGLGDWEALGAEVPEVDRRLRLLERVSEDGQGAGVLMLAVVGSPTVQLTQTSPSPAASTLQRLTGAANVQRIVGRFTPFPGR